MAYNNDQAAAQAQRQKPGAAPPDGFDLDVTLVEVADSAAQTTLSTDDNCGSTCGACTTSVA